MKPSGIYRFTVVLSVTLAIIIFFYWILSVLIPVVIVEANYQYKKILSDVFQTTDIRGVFLPNFKIDLTSYTSRNTVNGLTIPAIFVDEPIVFNVDPNDGKVYSEALKKGIAHASGTSFPGTGGVGYYFAHSSHPDVVRQYNAVFYLLGKLKEGDDVYIWHEGKRGDYKVYKKVITDPGDVSFLRQAYDMETVVLQTCWPPGSTQKRLLVFAKFVPNQ